MATLTQPIQEKHLELHLKLWTAYKVADVWLVHRKGAAGQGLLHGSLQPDVADAIAKWFDDNGVKVFRKTCDLKCVDDAPLREAELTKQQGTNNRNR